MKRLVLDAGPLISLVSRQDHYHEAAKLGFSRLPQEFGEVITPLPIVFEVYKFVSRRESNQIAQYLLEILQQETIISIVDQELFLTILDLVHRSPEWSGTLQDASVLAIAHRFKSLVWTIDYKDLGFFKNISFWTP
ncbi:MAG: PIN domain-containing protein [Cyanobacteriota bacterium]|nr:PIN domain-containing protein [Cyanobacteriota bacterium]